MARCGCGNSAGVTIVGGDNTVVSGAGTPISPYSIDAHTDCAEARACFSGSGTIALNAGTGVISAILSAQVGNSMAIGSDGGLYVSPSTNTVTTGAGALGTGTIGNPVRASVTTWGFPSTADAGGTNIYTDSTGRLRGEPGFRSYYLESLVTRNFVAPALAVPAGALVNVDVPFTFLVNNPDPYRNMLVVCHREFDAKLTIPAAGAASYGADGVELGRIQNTGGSTMTGVHAYASRMVQETSLLVPGGSINLSMQPQLGGGAGATLASQFNMAFRVLLLPI